MTRFTDGKKTVEITMHIWDGKQYGEQFENDFFDAACLTYDEATDAYIVEDVQYLIEQAEDWRLKRGDYEESEEDEQLLGRLERVVDWDYVE